jgi:hypothetical protein
LWVVLIFADLCGRGVSLPEPGFVMYGTVSNMEGTPVEFETVVWQLSSSSSAVSVDSRTLNVNGQLFYIATVPFETRLTAGIGIGSATPNILPLMSTATTFARLAKVNGTNANISYASIGSSNTFTFGPADRGRIERVDLSMTVPMTFGQWLAQYGLPGNSNPNSDPTHKGMTLMAQFIAGLNPNDPKSLLQLIGIQPMVQEIQIRWLSQPGKLYSVQEGRAPNGPFTLLQDNIVATLGTNLFIIPMPTNTVTLFVRVFVH